ncbi:MAG: hypothetical protein HQL08_13745 [Nitrospirae bacterium]|nr:hypothetical protein [Nitrospirota bacterium]
MSYKQGMPLFHISLAAVILAAGICCNVFAGGADWKPYAADKKFSYYYDANRVAYPYKAIHNVLNVEVAKVGIIKVWTKRVIKDEKGREWQTKELKKSGLATKGYDRYEYTISSKELSCPDKKYRLFSETDYSKDGNELGSSVKEPGSANWEPILPDSETEALQLVICRKPKNKESDPAAVQTEGQ